MKLDHDSNTFPVMKPIPVRFEFNPPVAITVFVAGTFNDSRPEASRWRSSGVGNWWNETAPAPRAYGCCVIMDVLRMPDPLARKTAPKPYRGGNAIMEVPGLPEKTYLSDTEN